MSDKSFGDHMSRGIVKNPLLSTAVTGLSIEDLTQNAVLLPVSRTQELFERQDQTGPHSHTLAHAEHPNIPSGDANFTPINLPHPHTSQQNAKNSKIENPHANAWQEPKIEDDFDVNEYFARLQGTRYVSAPINLKEDSNTNLDAREENLEEINLNEPDKGSILPEDVQQSLTADIAQNFSQLPTVLPQVASAVFSSFSNMLSMKSREHTPDEVRPVESHDAGVPLHGVSEVKEVAPPPKEPPASGPGNFRITTKKKYAQIPGLSSGETAQVPSYAPPSNQTYFTPTINDNPNNETNIISAPTTNIEPNVFSNTVQNIPNDNRSFDSSKESSSVATASVTTPLYNTPELNAQPIIPPPPMFSNSAKRDGLPSPGKSLLPPSVARRIASNKPTINTQPPAFSNFDNIFVPAPVTDIAENQAWPPTSSITSSEAPPAPPLLAQNPPTSSLPSSYTSQAPSQQAFIPASLNTSPMPPVNALSHGNLPPPPTNNSFVQMTASPTNASVFTSKPPIENPVNISLTSASTVPVTSLASPAKLPPSIFMESQSLPASIFTPVNLSQPAQGPPPSNIPTIAPPVSLISATASPQIFNPYLQTSNTSGITTETKSILDPEFKDPITSQMPPAPAETKIPEPPKAVGSTNFRMTKKRPQYYSGPIEGIGAISNNMKPTLNPVDTTSFQGAVFTPEIAPSAHQAAMFASDNIAENQVAAPTAFQGAIFTTNTTEKQDNLSLSTSNQSANLTATQPDLIAPGAAQYEYNINKQGELSRYDINKAPEPTACDTNYNIAFDMSRQTTDSYEPPKQESAFGIIGSLKSKLSSLDINKIQNSVTTFFDPTYNASKSDAAKEYEVPAFGQSQGGIEIFVPNKDQQHVQPYNYNTYQANFTYGQGAIPNPTDYYQQQMHNLYSPVSYYSQPNYGTNSYTQQMQGQQSYCEMSTETPYGDISTGTGFTGVFENNATYDPISTTHVHDKELDKNNDSSVVYQEYEESKATQSILPEESKKVQTNIVENLPDKIDTDPREVDSIKNVMENLNVNDVIENNYLNVAQRSNVIGNVTSPFAYESGELNTKKDAPGVLTNINQPNYFDMMENTDKNIEESVHQNNVSTSLFSAPLDDVSSIIATQLISDAVSEVDDDVSSNSNKEQFDYQASSDRLMAMADFGEDGSSEESRQSNDLNICETCREVTKPEEKGADLTSQLIENITSPIQLLNPVEVPLTESNSVPVGFDVINQCAEITLIADETIETLQVQSAAELLDDKDDTNIKRDYGWRTESSFPPSVDLLEHDYTFKLKSNAVGFIGDNNLFFENIPNNASDEIKAEFKVSQDDDAPLVLQTQMSIPTAPPEEDFDEAKSDETGGLDVQSIEQDASNDFTVFEEFVIEPSETDDDKLRDQSEESKDTFTNRVDRFKKLESSEDLTEHFPANPNTMMPSYFDTGNYAVETHFRNSLPSPSSTVKSSESNMPFRIPPGFEDRYDAKQDNNKNIEPKIPDTSTQTRSTPTLTFSEMHTKNVVTISTAKLRVSPITHETKPEVKQPVFDSAFCTSIVTDEISPGCFGVRNTDEVIQPVNLTEDSLDPPSDVIKDKVQEKKVTSLPDPINFFASTTEETNASDSINRLASYFTSPAKTDSAKSFFELSQGQDHFRQTNVKKDGDIDSNKPFFVLSQRDHYKEDISSITHDEYIANMNLMKDLASCQNIEPNKEQVVRTVNYFTVEYDDIGLNKGEPSIKELNDKNDLNVNKEKNRTEETFDNDISYIKVVNDCKYCCDLKAGPILNLREVDFDSLGKVSFKQAMDTGGPKAKDGVNTQREGRGEVTVNLRVDDVLPDGDNSEGIAMMTENRMSSEYELVKHHWFYRVDLDGKSTWRGFSTNDSAAIEKAFHSPDLNDSTLVPTDGGRFDVNVVGRLRIAVYWNDKPTNVRRCSWFYKGTTDARYVPYTEPVAEKLEEEYRHGITTGEWHRRLSLPNNEMVVMHGPAVMVHFLQGGPTDAFSAPNLFTFGKRVYRNPPKFKVPNDVPTNVDHLLLLVHGAGEWRSQKEKIQSTMRPRVVRRGFDESEIEDLEPSSIDHLLLLCHGVGSACDMRFRSVEEVVDDFRATSLQLLQSHYRNSCDSGVVGRVEVLPISWHASLHAGPCGVDRRLARVTLASIPRLRNFTNDTVLDVLFYTSPHYCQMIIDTVCGELNRVYNLFKARNPDFKGGVSLGGHSLGSVILYDLLCNQEVSAPLYPPLSVPQNTQNTQNTQKQYLSGTPAHNPAMKYPRLDFEPLAFYALGSPIAIFECIRGVESLGKDFRLPTCRNFFNIFHPYDPIAYRIEPLINPQLQNVKPSLIPHHKGRKRMHLELKETMARVGADLKQKLVESIRSTWTSMWAASAPPPDHQLEKVVEEEIEKEELDLSTDTKEENSQTDIATGDMLGNLNGGRRVDFVLQEAPFEMINEYLFAMSSHVCYWESEDTMLLILREIYDSIGICADVTVPQQSMTVQRARNDEKLVVIGADSPSTSRNDAYI